MRAMDCSGKSSPGSGPAPVGASQLENLMQVEVRFVTGREESIIEGCCLYGVWLCPLSEIAYSRIGSQGKKLAIVVSETARLLVG